MSILENFQNLFIEIWQQGIAGINFTQIGLGIVILLLFLYSDIVYGLGILILATHNSVIFVNVLSSVYLNIVLSLLVTDISKSQKSYVYDVSVRNSLFLVLSILISSWCVNSILSSSS